MMVLTLVGCASLIIATSGAGRVYIFRKREKLKGARVLLELVRYITVHIEVYREPLPEIYASFDGGRGLSEHLLRDGLFAATEKSGLIPDENIGRLMREIDGCLGKKTAEETVRTLRFAEERLVSYIGGLEEKLPETERISRAISLLTGVSVIILLI